MPFIPPKLTYKQYSILDTAAPIFAHFGYAKTTLDDIGRALNMNKASLYYHFQNKEDLFRHIIERESGAYIRQVEELLQSVKSPKKRILRYLENRKQLIDIQLNLPRLREEASAMRSPILKKISADLKRAERELLESVILIGQKHKGWNVKNPRLLSECILDVSDAMMTNAEMDTFDAEGIVLPGNEVRTNKTLYLVNLVIRGLNIRSPKE